MSTFKFGEIRADVDRVGSAENLEVYTVRLTAGHDWIETKIVTPLKIRSSGSDFEMAAMALENMQRVAQDPKLWSMRMSRIGNVSPEEIGVLLQMAERLSPYLEDANREALERSHLYSEYREGPPGPLELGIGRNLQLPEHIALKEEIAQFFAYLYLVDKTSFHPDEDFNSYVDRDGRRAYSVPEAEARNILMMEAFQAAEAHDLDLYELALFVGALTGATDDPENEAEAPAWLKGISNFWI